MTDPDWSTVSLSRFGPTHLFKMLIDSFAVSTRFSIYELQTFTHERSSLISLKWLK